MIPPDHPATKRLGDFTDRVLMLPTLVHQDIIRTCPDGDIRVVRMLGLLMWLSAAWQCTLFANATRVMLAPDGSWQLAFIAIGTLMAAIVLLVDAIVFIAASWNAQGLAEVERTHEFKLPTTRNGQAKKGALIAGRFAMTVLIANFMAITAGLLAFEKDINRILESKYQSTNAALLREKAANEDAELQKSKAAQQELMVLIPSMETEERTLRALHLEPKVDDAQLRLATQRIPVVQNARLVADRELKNARALLARERAVDGYGRRVAQDRVAAAERDMANANRALDDAQRRVQEQTEARHNETRRKEGLAATRLAEVTARKSEVERQIADARVAYDKRLASREATVRAMAERDPRHIPRDDGLLVRLQALKELSKDEAIAYALYGFDAILILLELAAVMGKTFTLIPMTYATRMVELDLVRAIETAGRLKKAWKGESSSDIPGLPDAAPEPEPTETPTVPAEPPTPLNRSAEKPKRHAPRWRPSLRRDDGEPPTEH